jgi:hypothetical protein
MPSRRFWIIWWLAVLACLIALSLLPEPESNASPSSCDLYDQRMCEGNLGSVRYCPDTGTQVSWNVPCPNLVFGPDVPGHDDGDDD